jgi:hypothetical protein
VADVRGYLSGGQVVSISSISHSGIGTQRRAASFDTEFPDAAAIVQNTSALRVAGRISLSGTRLWPGYGINNRAGVARIRDPFLYVGTPPRLACAAHAQGGSWHFPQGRRARQTQRLLCRL